MKIDLAQSLPPWSDRLAVGQPAIKKQSSNVAEAGKNAEAVAQSPVDSNDFGPPKGTYSPASLKAAAARNNIYPEVAENNRNAVRDAGPLPRQILDHLNMLIAQR